VQQEFKKIEETVSHFKQYVDTKITKTKLDAAAKTSDVITYVVVGMLVTVIFFLFVIFVSDAAAYAIGNYFGKSWLGFLLVGGFYFLAGLLIWFSRERLLRIPIMNAIIERFFTQETEQDEEI
jgi:ABC-type glycerol-3-phosphate transport system permease component